MRHAPPSTVTWFYYVVAALLIILTAGCGRGVSHYALIEDRLRAGNPLQADKILEDAQDDYDTESLTLYRLDRGMTLHLAGQYQLSNSLLEQAEEEIEDLYTRRVRTEVKAFNLLPAERSGKKFVKNDRIRLSVAKRRARR